MSGRPVEKQWKQPEPLACQYKLFDSMSANFATYVT
jgi:hypothetical protein